MPIFDQGYQHWKGPLTGHAWRWLAIARQGVRVQMQNRILRLLLLFAWLPALALVIAVAIWGLVEQQSEGVLGLVRNMLPAEMLLEPRAYRAAAWTLAYSFFFKVEMFFIMLLVVTAGPSLISADLRFNALPLYFARPLTRLDYFLGKLGVIAALVAAVAVGPAVFAYLIGVCFSLDLGVVVDTYPVLLGSVAYGLIITLSAGTLMLALSSLSRRSLYVGIAWFALWWVSGAAAGMLTGLHMASLQREIYLEAREQMQAESALPAQGGKPPPAAAGRRGKPQAPPWQVTQERVAQRLAEDAPHNWRPVVSYTANLERLGEGLLQTDDAWVQVGRAVDKARKALPFGPRPPAPANERRLADSYVPQYPWTWSAGVLAALLGISVWTLSRRVRSLDQLR
jgi:ABC-2 type transport system permease protein